MHRRKFRGMYIARKTLRKQFDPSNFQPETYLLCELHWGESVNFWIHWLRNDNKCHAEVYFLEKIFEARSSRTCHMTWYLSWSPCEKCCYKIQDFLKRHRNVNLDIRVARLYYFDRREYHAGLRALDHLSGVTIRVMEMRDYKYCWKEFRQGHVDDDSWPPGSFESAIAKNRLRLEPSASGVVQVSVKKLRRAALMRPKDQYSDSGIETETNVRLIKAHQCPRKQHTNPEIPMAAASGRDPSRKNHQGWEMEPGDFQSNFSPSQHSGRVYLLYEIRWRGGAVWRNWCSNNPGSRHAEVNFLENHFNNRPQVPCSITWFLSASPCGNCSESILEFLRSHPNVTLTIYTTKLFRHHDPRNRQGLRNLVMNGVTLRIMEVEDYTYCWRNFVAYQPGDDDYSPQDFTADINRNRGELHNILSECPPLLSN